MNGHRSPTRRADAGGGRHRLRYAPNVPDPQPPTASSGPERPEAAGIGLAGILDLLRAATSADGGAAGVTPDLRGDAEGVHVTGATLDSRAVRPGDLYAGLPGANVHGARFATQAQEAGAVALLTDPDGAQLAVDAGCTLPTVVVPDPRGVLGQVSAAIHAHPDRRLAMIGITGTNGKTTTTTLIHGALTALGRTAGLIGTIETRIGSTTTRAVRTTPESPELHALLGRMVDEGVQACAMEVSSHALTLHRVDGVRFGVAAFTNLSILVKFKRIT